MNTYVNFHRLIGEGAESTTDARFRSATEIVLNDHQIDQQLQNAEDDVNEMAENFTSMGSGWLIHSIGEMTIGIASYQPIYASSYFPTPEFIEKKKATVNIQNTEDDRCFLYCVIAHELNIENNAVRVSRYLPYVCCFDRYSLSRIHRPNT